MGAFGSCEQSHRLEGRGRGPRGYQRGRSSELINFQGEPRPVADPHLSSGSHWKVATRWGGAHLGVLVPYHPWACSDLKGWHDGRVIALFTECNAILMYRAYLLRDISCNAHRMHGHWSLLCEFQHSNVGVPGVPV